MPFSSHNKGHPRTADAGPGLLAKEVLSKVLHDKASTAVHHHLPHCPHWKEVTMGSPPLRSGSLNPTCLKAEELNKVLGLLLRDIFVLSLLLMGLFIYLYPYGIMDVCRIFLVKIQYCVVH